MTVRIPVGSKLIYDLWHWKPIGEQYDNEPYVTGPRWYDTASVLRRDAQAWCREHCPDSRLVMVEGTHPEAHVPWVIGAAQAHHIAMEFDRAEDAEAFRKLWIENPPEPPPEENGIDIEAEIMAALRAPDEPPPPISIQELAEIVRKKST